jgi:methionyl-tRNA synthetase
MKFYATTPIYYVNDKPHIGSAYTTIVCDALARAHRLRGDQVRFVTGTDENSQKNVEAMEKLGENDLKAYLDRMASAWQSTWKEIGIANDDFIRTTEDRHLKAVERFWKASMEAGDIYLGSYEALYCEGCEEFKTETDLVDGKCPLHPNRELKKISEKNYFFRLSAYRDELLALYERQPSIAQPDSRLNEVRQFVSEHLADVSISREASSIPNGIPVPGDDTQRVYVWFDALINYISAVGFGTDDAMTEAWWPADLHLIGKDILKFHCALWPAMLLSAAKSDPLLKKLKQSESLLPKNVFVHGFFTINGQKISKSLGNAIDPRDLVAKFGNDVVRYYLLREIPFGEDGDFSYARLEERYASDLANTLGNLVQRVVAMSRKYFDGRAPKIDTEKATAIVEGAWSGGRGISDIEIAYDGRIDAFRIDEALNLIWGLGESKGSGLMQANKFIEETKPFQLIKTDEAKTGEILYAILESIRHYAWMLDPIMPETSKIILATLGQDRDEEAKKGLAELRRWGGLTPDSTLPEPQPIFPRIDPGAAS